MNEVEKDVLEAAEREKRGPPVVGGELRYISVSQGQTFDPNTHGGCNRKWWFEKVMGLGGEATEATRKGKASHARIEHYLKTGEDTLSMIERAGKHFIPKPDPRFLIEHHFGDADTVLAFAAHRKTVMLWSAQPANSETAQRELDASRERMKPILRSALHAHGVPFVGYIDLVNPTGYWIDNDGDTYRDSNTVVEVVDWKTSVDFEKYGKLASDLPGTLQMNGYAEWVSRNFADVEKVRLSHGYFQTRGATKASKRTVLIPLDAVKERWQATASQVLAMRDAAAEIDPMKIEPNFASCRAFNKDCQFKARCPRSKEQALADFFGNGRVSMSLADKLKAKRAEAEARAGGAPASPAPASPAPKNEEAKTAPKTVADEVARLRAESSGNATPPKLHPCGDPQTADNTSTIPSGEAIHVGCPVQCWKWRHKPAGTHPGIVPPDAPASTPATSAVPVPPEVVPTLSLEVAAAAAITAKAIADAPAPALTGRAAKKAAKAAAEAQSRAGAADAAATRTDEAAEDARTARAEVAADKARDSVKYEAPPPTERPGEEKPAPTPAAMLVLFVDCMVTGYSLIALDEYIRGLCTALCQEFKAADIRCGSNDTMLGFNKWKGALAACVASNPPAPGNYILTHPDEVAEVVINALKPMCGMYVRGLR